VLFCGRYCDRLVYRRQYVPPGDVDAQQAVQQAEQQGFTVHVGTEGGLLLDFAHPLICPETGALNSNTTLFADGMRWWESTGDPITDEEHRMLLSAYQQSRIPFEWRNPGDAVVIDSRRIAHGWKP